MKIEIETNGSVHDTTLRINGVEVDFQEFDLMASKLRKGTGVKMQLVVKDGERNDFRSYYGGDFQRWDDLLRSDSH